VHAAGEHVRHDDVVGVGAVVHQVDDDVALGDLLQRLLVLIIHAHFVQQVDDDLGEVVAELVVRQDVEVRDDLVEVFPDLSPYRLLGEGVLRHMRLHGGRDRGISGERPPREAWLLLLIAAQPRAELVNEPPPS